MKYTMCMKYITIYMKYTTTKFLEKSSKNIAEAMCKIIEKINENKV